MNARAQFDRLRVVLVKTRNPLNLGAVARAMSNFGFLRLRVVNPFEPSFREARSAVGASDLLASAEEFNSLAEAVADCTLVVGTTAGGRRNLQLPLRPLTEGARLIRKRLGAGPVALLFGSERTGLSNEDFCHCHWLMRIPARQEHRSLNLAQAVAICLYELVRDSKAALPREKEKLAAAADLERVCEVTFDVLRLSGYMKLRYEAPTKEKVRRMIRRHHLSPGDAEAWLGMLRQILWKMRAENPHGAS
jgi:tRNA/rRNA methyltransferase